MNKFLEERAHFPALEKEIYFNSASFGIVPDYVLQITEENNRTRCLTQDIAVAGMRQYEMLEKVRPVYAQLINAQPEDIAYGLSSSQMYVALTGNLVFQPGDNVVVVDNAFITTPFAFNAREADGLEVRMAKTENGYISAEALCGYADERTRVIAVNHVESSTGFRIDMEYIGNFCQEHDIIFAVDTAQSAGIMEIDVERMHIDFLVGTDYKWLCHFRGVGFAYVSPRLRGNSTKLACRSAGWGSDTERFNTAKRHWDPHPDARRYEYGGFHNVGIYCVSEVIRHYLALGKKDVQEYALELADYCYEKAAASPVVDIAYPFPKENRSAIVVLKIGGKYDLSTEKLRQYGVFAAVDGGPDTPHGCYTSRLALHYYLTRQDIDKLFDAIERCCGL